MARSRTGGIDAGRPRATERLGDLAVAIRRCPSGCITLMRETICLARTAGRGPDQSPWTRDHRSVPVELSCGRTSDGVRCSRWTRLGLIFTAVEHWNIPSVHIGWMASAATASCPAADLHGACRCMADRGHLRLGGWPCGWLTLPYLLDPSPTRSSLGHQAASSSRVPSRTSGLPASDIASIRRRRIASTGIICDQTISLDGFYTPSGLPRTLCGASASKDPESGKTLVFITNNFSLPAATICALYKSPLAGELFFKWIKQQLRMR